MALRPWHSHPRHSPPTGASGLHFADGSCFCAPRHVHHSRYGYIPTTHVQFSVWSRSLSSQRLSRRPATSHLSPASAWKRRLPGTAQPAAVLGCSMPAHDRPECEGSWEEHCTLMLGCRMPLRFTRDTAARRASFWTHYDPLAFSGTACPSRHSTHTQCTFQVRFLAEFQLGVCGVHRGGGLLKVGKSGRGKIGIHHQLHSRLCRWCR